MHRAISQVEDGVIPFSLAAINLAEAVQPENGTIAIVGDADLSALVSQTLIDTYEKFGQKPQLATFEHADDTTRQAITQASAIVALKHDFQTATALVDVCEHGSIYEIMGLMGNEGVVWVKGSKHLTRVDMNW
ncbi:MAG: hypothetical protein HGA71_08440 [Azonexaceae bacterium]|nr:hypothetical protein [Azonexaceae bacterium]